MLNNLKTTTWEYIVHCKDKRGKKYSLKSVGKFNTPKKAPLFVSENGQDWTFFGNFGVCADRETAQSSIIEMFKNKTSKRGKLYAR